MMHHVLHKITEKRSLDQESFVSFVYTSLTRDSAIYKKLTDINDVQFLTSRELIEEGLLSETKISCFESIPNGLPDEIALKIIRCSHNIAKKTRRANGNNVYVHADRIYIWYENHNISIVDGPVARFTPEYLSEINITSDEDLFVVNQNIDYASTYLAIIEANPEHIPEALKIVSDRRGPSVVIHT